MTFTTQFITWVKRRQSKRRRQGNDPWLRGYDCMCVEIIEYLKKKAVAKAEIKRRKAQ